ncbi:MAG: tetratricopeptide repeat protein [Capsulimonadales bacterium]|nr:tetratricopeptide repeat protein [Capsulimonadales bacterium]
MATIQSPTSPPEPRRRPTILFLLGTLLLVAVIAVTLQVRRLSFERWLRTASIEELAAAAPRHLEETELFVRLGTEARQREQWPRAVKAFQHACELAPDRADAWIGWARSTYEIADFRAADAILTDFLRRHPEDSRVYLERAALRRDARHTESAWLDADRATRLKPDFGDAWALRGDLCLDQGIAGEAEVSYLRARALMPDSAWPMVGLYQAYIANKKHQEALKLANHLRERFPNLPERSLYLGEASVLTARTSEEYAKARDILETARKSAESLRQMDRFTVEFLIGRSYYGQKDWKNALAYFETADKIAPNNPDLLFLLGRTYRFLGQEAKAEATLTRHRKAYEDQAELRRFQAKLNETPDDRETRLAFARWYVSKDLLRPALIQYEELIARNPNDAVAQQERAALERPGAR